MVFINFFMSFFSCQATQKATLKSNMPFWFCVCRFFVIIQYSFSEYTPSSFPCFDTSTYNGHLENYGEKPCFVSHPVFSNVFEMSHPSFSFLFTSSFKVQFFRSRFNFE